MILMMKDLDYYSRCFANLNTAVIKGLKAPHKPILLLSIIDLIENDVIRNNCIYLTEELVSKFYENVDKFYYIPQLTVFKPDIEKPYFHMGHESFWRLIPKRNDLAKDFVHAGGGMAAEPTEAYGKEIKFGHGLNEKKPSYTVKWLRENFEFAVIDPELFMLLQDADARNRLREVLTETYFNSAVKMSSGLSALLALPLLAMYVAG